MAEKIKSEILDIKTEEEDFEYCKEDILDSDWHTKMTSKSDLKNIEVFVGIVPESSKGKLYYMKF